MERTAIRTAFRNWLQRWALRRQGPDSLPLILAARRIYIVPTRAGWVFALLLAVMFVAGMNYGNGLALLLTFWLVGFMLVAMVQTQRQLAGLKLLQATAAPVFAGSSVQLQLTFEPAAPLASVSVAPASPMARAADTAVCKVVPNGLVLPIVAAQRGIWRAPALKLESVAPFGLFRTWAWLHLGCDTWIYPEPRGDIPEPQSAGDKRGAQHLAHSQEELAWLRDFRDGDSPRQVAWKAYARGAPLLVREYRGAAAAEREFSYDTLATLGPEERLSQLCKWIVHAEHNGDSWTLLLPGRAPAKGFGIAHRDHCLRQLALFDLPDTPA